MTKDRILLSDHFTFKRLLRFAIPSILMLVFVSIYGMVDGLCISNFVGEKAFTAVNLIWPWGMLLSAFGFMFGAGGTALVGKVLGEGDKDKAQRYFTFIVLSTFVLGAILAIFSDIFMERICILLGSSEELLPLCKQYGYFISSAIPLFMLQSIYQNFSVVAEKPHYGLLITIFSGCTNIVCDLLFVGLFKWEVIGAASATVLSQLVGAFVPTVYFLNKKNSSLLHFVNPKMSIKSFLKVIVNGSSELLSNVSVSLLNILYNFQLLKYIGEQGVAAYGVVQYVCFFFMSVFFGYMVGVGPLISYNYGSKNSFELKNIVKKSAVIIAIFGSVMTLMGMTLAKPIAFVYTSYNPDLMELTKRAFFIYSVGFVLMGFNVFASALFTSLNNGPLSLIISSSRTLIFEILTVFLLPLFFKEDGIWMSFAVSEFLAIIVSVTCLLINRKRYQY